MPKSINNIPSGTKFKYSNKTYTKLSHLDHVTNKPHDKHAQHYGVENDGISFRYFAHDNNLLTEETVETTTEEWVRSKRFGDIPIGTEFKWNGKDSRLNRKIDIRDDRWIMTPGYIELCVNTAYLVTPDGYNMYVWTLEKVTKTEKKWV